MANTAITADIAARAVSVKIAQAWISADDADLMTHWFDVEMTLDVSMMAISDFDNMIEPRVMGLIRRCKETDGRFRNVSIPDSVRGGCVTFGGVAVGVFEVPIETQFDPHAPLRLRIGVCYR